MPSHPLNRRQFLKTLLALAAGGAASLNHLRRGGAQDPFETLPAVYLPMVSNRLSDAGGLGKVLHLHAPEVTNWYFDRIPTTDAPRRWMCRG